MTTLSKPISATVGHLLTGKVVSISMKNTIVVLVSWYYKHPKYGKYLTRTRRVKAHDEGNTCVLGDMVTIKEVKPISKDKHFTLVSKKPSETGSEEV